jgi:hypothetical protein
LRATITITHVATVVLLALALGVSGCGGGGDGVPSSLNGTVLDDGTLTPVSGARVIANTGQSDTTDANGDFTLSSLSNGAGTLTVACTGYRTATVAIYPTGGAASLGFVYLKPATLQGRGSITGAVTEAGSAADGTALQAGGRHAVSKSDGSYTIYNVPVGSQTVVALSADGQTGGSASGTVVNQGTLTLDITLTTSPPAPPSLP